MIDFKLANVLLSDGEHSINTPELYWHLDKMPLASKHETTILGGPYGEVYDFSTYFNALPIIKWRRYTVVDNVYLHMRAKGSFGIRLLSYKDTASHIQLDLQALDNMVALEDLPQDVYPTRTCVLSHHVNAASFTDIDLAFPAEALEDDLLAFELICEDEVEVESAYYYTKVGEKDVRPVELAVATTTFKKERYILANIAALRQEVGGSDEPIARHFTLHVIDNGRTLDAEALTSGCVHVHPNPNVGGSGGFTRGMLEAMAQEPKATHVILLDDDVEVSPESFKRTFNLLSLLKDTYKDAFISGAMLSLEKPYLFHEDVGYVNQDGMYGPAKRTRDLRNIAGVISTETAPYYETAEKHEVLKTDLYAGWWYCCVPVSTIHKHGLPLPLFVRGDDTEFGARCGEHILTMNGIAIWHMTFQSKIRANVDRYQVLRNSLIGQATTGVFPGRDFVKTIKILFNYDLKTFFYDGCELTIAAIKDFMRGPSYLMRVDGSKLMQQNGQKNEKLQKLQDMDPALFRGLRIDHDKLGQAQKRSLATRAYDYVTYNGHLLPENMQSPEIGVIPFSGYSPNEIRNKTRLLVVSSDLRECAYREMDRARADALKREFNQLMAEYQRNRQSIDQSWADAREELTSAEFWKDYLKRMAE
ncbi:MAG: hypothetical protein ACOX4F_06025 [Atopobiaceae bacterium]|jgi:galactofuranosylgalactofuranosylrhamnosyl-N-acetylglucosaminyl-diphospho-decaprenol beta-1,5/1,6-galactofuranosyltransferase